MLPDIIYEAVKVIKAAGEGTFRGGDPEYLQQKKQEAQDNKEAEGDTISAAIKVLKAADGGEGSFRGGDPELLQQKREEKRLQNVEEQGGADEVPEESGEAPDLSEIEETKRKENDRKEAAGKSVLCAVTDSGYEVSPVDTLEDYQPRNNNGDPLHTAGTYPDQKDVELCPPRRGPNQWKPWSEVLGFKVPAEGAPWQHMRRYILSGDSPEKIRHEENLLTRSIITELVEGLEQHPEFDKSVHDAFFKLYDNLNRGLTWSPDFQIYKAEGEGEPGKYVARQVGENGKWNYAYSSTPHSDNHGIQHTGNRQGHSIEVHPEWHAQDPGHTNPEGAFHHARAKVMEQGGSFPLAVHNPDTLQHEQHTLVIKPGVKDKPIELRPTQAKEGKKEGGLHRFKNLEGFEDHIRTNHVNTEFDIHGKPWFQHMDPTSDKARVRSRYFPGSPYARPAPSKVDKNGFHPDPSGHIGAVRRRIAKEKNDQLRAAGITPPSEVERKPLSSKKPEPTSSTYFTDLVHAGHLPRKQVDAPIIREGNKVSGSNRVWRIDWKNGDEQAKVTHGLYREHEGLARKIAHDLVREEHARRLKNNLPGISSSAHTGIVNALAGAPTLEAVRRTLHSYDPSNERKATYSTYLHGALEGEQRGALQRIVQEHMAHPKGEVSLSDDKKRRKIEEAAITAPESGYEETYPEWLGRARNHVNDYMTRLVRSGAPREDIARANTYLNHAHNKLSEMERNQGVNEEQDDPHVYAHFLRYGDPENKIPPFPENEHNAFTIPPHHESNIDQVNEHMRQAVAEHQPSKVHGIKAGKAASANLDDLGLRHLETRTRIRKENLKTVGDLLASLAKRPILPKEVAEDAHGEINQKIAEKNKELEPVAKAIGSKKSDGKEPKKEPSKKESSKKPAQPDVSYIGKQGSPGAYKYLYEAGDGGNIVQGTNAPPDHEDHVPDFGPPQAHESEPTPEMNPELFDEQGQKLDRPVPEGVEVENNPAYDPDKTKGSHWVKRYQDPATGDTQYLYRHRDQILDPKMKHNLAIKYLDVQLPKIREWYQTLLRSEQDSERALGLFVALLDQGRVPMARLESLKVSGVTFGDDGTVTLAFDSGGTSDVSLDASAKSSLESLVKDKQPDDPVFVLDGNILDTRVLNKFFHEKFGVIPDSFQVYHSTKDFSSEFQKVASKIQGESPLDFLQASREQVIHKIADDYGVTPEEISNTIDPVTAEAAVMSAFMHNGVVEKSDKKEIQDKYVFQGIPISIENRAGTWRTLHDQMGQTKMLYDYGYIRRTTGMDGDHVDVYIGSNPNANTAFVIHQMKAPEFERFDEDKIMIGFDSEEDAKEAYLKQYTNPKFYGGCTAIPMRKFKKKVFKTKDNPHMIKSVVWPVVSTHQGKSPDEEAFGQWLHSYPLHDHEFHWQALNRHSQKTQADQAQQLAAAGDQEPSAESEIGAAQ
jgi:hypothetical protein